MPEGSRYKFEGDLIQQPQAGAGSPSVGSIFSSFRGIDREAWQLQDEKIQLDLLKGAPIQNGFDSYMNLASIAGAAGDALASATFQQKAYSLQNAARGGGGGSGRGRRSGGVSTKSVTSELKKLQTEDLSNTVVAIQEISEKIKNGGIGAKEGFEEISSKILEQQQRAIDLYDKYAASGASASKLEQLQQETSLAINATKSESAKKIQKALKEFLYGDVPPAGTDYIEALSSHVAQLDGTQDAHLLLVPKKVKDSLGRELSGEKTPLAFDVWVLDSQSAEEAYFGFLKRKIPGTNEEQTLFVLPSNLKEYESLKEKAQKSVDDGLYSDTQTALNALLEQTGFKPRYSIKSTNGAGKSFEQEIENNILTEEWNYRGNRIGVGSDNPPVVSPLLGSKAGGSVFGNIAPGVRGRPADIFGSQTEAPRQNIFSKLFGTGTAEASTTPNPFQTELTESLSRPLQNRFSDLFVNPAKPQAPGFENVLGAISKRSQPQEQSSVVRLPEGPTRRASSGLISKPGGGYANTPQRVSVGAQTKIDPLTLRQKASMQALNGFKSFSNFVRGLF